MSSDADKTYWDYYSQFSKENTIFQSIPKYDTPIYTPTQEDKEDKYFQKLFE